MVRIENINEVDLWLQGVFSKEPDTLNDCIKLFKVARVDSVQMISRLTSAELKEEIGITNFGIRKTLLMHIEKLKSFNLNVEPNLKNSEISIPGSESQKEHVENKEEKTSNIPDVIKIDENQQEKEEISKLLFGENGVKNFKPLCSDKKMKSEDGLLTNFYHGLLSISLQNKNWMEHLMDYFMENNITNLTIKDIVAGFYEVLPDNEAIFFNSKFYQDGKPLPLISQNFKDSNATCYLKNYFVPLDNERKPIVLSIKSKSVHGASKLLNEVFGTSFTTDSNSYFHKNTADISCDSSQTAKGYHIIDSHFGMDKNDEKLDLLLNLASLVIIHVTDADFINDTPNEDYSHVISVLNSKSIQYVTFVRDSTKMNSSGRSINVPNTRNDETSRRMKVMKISKFLRPFIQKMKEDHKPVSFKEIQNRIKNQTSMLNVQILSKSYTDFLDEVQSILSSLQNVKKKDIFQFTYSTNPKKFHPLVQKLYDTAINAENDVKFYVLLFSNMLNHWNESYIKSPQNDLVVFKKSYEQLKLDKSTPPDALEESKKKLLKLTNELEDIKMTIDHFWREIIRYYSLSFSDSKTITLFQNLLLAGIPIELVNGDTLSIEYEFLTKVLKVLSGRKLTTLSIVGPQSSGKSTLLNEMYGCIFPVSAGRCTQGLYITFTTFDGNDTLILDSEGLFSIEKGSTKYDRQIVLLAMSVSHKMMVNIKGELGSHVQDIMKICLFAANSLKITTKKPKMYFVLRDVTDFDNNLSDQRESIEREFDNVARDFKFDWHNLIEFGPDNYQLMASAFNTDKRKICEIDVTSSDQNVLFKEQCDSLKQKLYVEKNMQFSIDDWFNTAHTIWANVQQFDNLDNLSSIAEYVKYWDLNYELNNMLHKHHEEFETWASKFSYDRNLSADENKLNFETKSAEKLLKFVQITLDHFKSKDCSDTYLLKVERESTEYLNSVLIFQKRNWKEKVMNEDASATIENLNVELKQWVDQADFTNLNELKKFKIKSELGAKIDSAKQMFELKMKSLTSQQENIDEFFKAVFNKYQSENIRKGEHKFPTLHYMQFEDVDIPFSNIFKNAQVQGVYKFSKKSFNIPVVNKFVQKAPFSIFEVTTPLTNPEIYPFSLEINNLVNNQSLNFQTTAELKSHIKTVLEACHRFNNFTDMQGCRISIQEGTVVIPIFNYLRNAIVRTRKEAAKKNFEAQKKTFLQIIESDKKFVDDMLEQKDAEYALAQRTTDTIQLLYHNEILKTVKEKYKNELSSATNLPPQKLEELTKNLAHCNDAYCFSYYVQNTKFKEEQFHDMFESQELKINQKYRDLYVTEHQRIENYIKSKIDELSECKLNEDTQNGNAVYYFCLSYLIDDAYAFGTSKEVVLLSPKNMQVQKPSYDISTELLKSGLKISNFRSFLKFFTFSMRFDVDEHLDFSDIANEIRKKNFQFSLGCTAYCPYCKRKCTGVSGCTQHKTDHKLASWGGCRYNTTNNAFLMVCDSESNFNHPWVDEVDTTIPFHEHVQKYNPSWRESLQVSKLALPSEEKEDWNRIGKSVCDYHGTNFKPIENVKK